MRLVVRRTSFSLHFDGVFLSTCPLGYSSHDAEHFQCREEKFYLSSRSLMRYAGLKLPDSVLLCFLGFLGNASGVVEGIGVDLPLPSRDRLARISLLMPRVDCDLSD